MLYNLVLFLGNNINYLAFNLLSFIYKRLNLQVLKGNPERANSIFKTLLNIKLLLLIPFIFK
jgi:hypothetical protein